MKLKNNYQIICTEKDFHRIKVYDIKEINYLKVELVLEKERLIKKFRVFMFEFFIYFLNQ